MAEPIEIKLEGIQGVTGADPLYVQLEKIDDFRMGYVETVAGKVGNAVDQDLTTNLITWPLLPPDGYVNGAFRRLADKNAQQYWLPCGTGVNDTPVNGALPFTLHKGVVQPPAGAVDQSGAFQFRELAQFGAVTYALDVKANKLYQVVGEVWSEVAAGLTATVTELYVGGAGGSAYMLVGQATGKPRQFAGGVWSDYTPAVAGKTGEHFCMVGLDQWMSSGNLVFRQNAAAPNQRKVGDAQYGIKRMLWFQNYILVGKPDGLYVVDPQANSTCPVQKLLDFPNADADNCRMLISHNQMAWFNVGEKLFAYTRGGQFLSQTFAEFEGVGGKPFYGGRIIGGFSDGERLYLALRVLTSDVTPVYQYYLVVYTGTGFHPIYYYQSTTAPTKEAGGVFLDSGNKLRFSLGADASQNANTGYVLVANDTARAVNGAAYGVNVGLRTGWQRFERPAHDKWLKEIIYSKRDYGTGGKLKFYYRKWGDTAWTLIGTSAAGDVDNAVLPIPAESGAQLGVHGEKFDFKVEFVNDTAGPLNSWYLTGWYVTGLVCYPGVRSGTLRAWLQYEESDGRSSPATVLAGLQAALAQAAPLKLTHPDGTTLYVRLYPVPNGDTINEYSLDGGVVTRHFTVSFRELA